MLLLKKIDSSAKVVKQTPCNAVSLAVSGAYTSDKFFLRTFFFYFNLIIDDLDGEKTQILVFAWIQIHQNKAYAEKLFACLSANFSKFCPILLSIQYHSLGFSIHYSSIYSKSILSLV